MPNMNFTEKDQICCGGHLSKPSLKLQAGALSMIYENGSLRYISDGKHELIRMIYSAVRDREWLTINPVITDEKVEIHPSSFRIEYNCFYRTEEINFSASYIIRGGSDGTIIFGFKGEALDSFEKSRIGFCVLHPVEECSGKPCIISHSDGYSETLTFPVYISPDQIFTDIKSMKWNIGGSDCMLVFSGDIFETEDQRNWTDASYKTYCTPLSLPTPATIRKGEKISQRIEFKAAGGDLSETYVSDEIYISVNPLEPIPIPDIGIGRSTRPVPLTKDEIHILRDIPFDHYRVDLYLFSETWRVEADLAAKEAEQLNYSLELALFFDENSISQLKDFISWVTCIKSRVAVICLFHKSEAVTTDLMLDTIAPGLKKVLPEVVIGCGTNANFAQINRKITNNPNAECIVYSIHPQEHASDNATIVENLQGQAYSVWSARQFAFTREIRVSPVNLQRRFNANIENFETPLSANIFPPQVDTRIMSLFGVCWTAGSLKYLCDSGVNGITFFETVGERGIIQGDFDSRWPEDFKTVKGMIFPVYHLFKWLLKDKSFRFISCRSSSPLEIDCMALSDGTTIKLIIVNFTSEKLRTVIHGLSKKIKLKILDAGSYPAAACDPKWIEGGWGNLFIEEDSIGLEPCSSMFIESQILVQNK